MWFVAGAATSAYAFVKARRAAEVLTPEGVRDRLAALALGARLLGDEVLTESAARETELRERLGLGLDGATRIEAAPTTPRQLTRKGTP